MHNEILWRIPLYDILLYYYYMVLVVVINDCMIESALNGITRYPRLVSPCVGLLWRMCCVILTFGWPGAWCCHRHYLLHGVGVEVGTHWPLGVVLREVSKDHMKHLKSFENLFVLTTPNPWDKVWIRCYPFRLVCYIHILCLLTHPETHILFSGMVMLEFGVPCVFFACHSTIQHIFSWVLKCPRDRQVLEITPSCLLLHCKWCISLATVGNSHRSPPLQED